jgi:hypothetical protein
MRVHSSGSVAVRRSLRASPAEERRVDSLRHWLLVLVLVPGAVARRARAAEAVRDADRFRANMMFC